MAQEVGGKVKKRDKLVTFLHFRLALAGKFCDFALFYFESP